MLTQLTLMKKFYANILNGSKSKFSSAENDINWFIFIIKKYANLVSGLT